MPKTTSSKKKNRRNRSREKNRRSRSQKAEKRKSRKNSPLLMNQKTHLRNEVELSPQRFLAETSTKGVSAQDLRSKFQPIYHQPRGSKIGLKIRTRQNLRRSSRSRSGRYQGTNGNLYCIFCLKNDNRLFPCSLCAEKDK